MFEINNLSGGVRLVNYRTDKYKTAKINVSMALPMVKEKAAVNSLLADLMKRSCKAYPDFTLLNGKLDELYGAVISAGVSKIGDAQIISLSATCLDDRFSFDGTSIIGACAGLMASMIFEPSFLDGDVDNDALELVRRLRIEQILEEKNDKRAYAYDKCIENMCADEPYGISRYGTLEEVKNVTGLMIYDAWKYLLENAVVQITVVGNTDIQLISDIFTNYFSAINRTPCKIDTEFKPNVENSKMLEEEIAANQGKLVMGFRTGMKDCDDNYFANRVMCDIFGGGTYSKLFTIIREKMSLAYYCSSRLISSKGLVIVQSGIDTDKKDAVISGVMEQLKAVAEGDFDDEIIASSKRSLKEGLYFSSPEDFCAWYASQLLDEKIVTPAEAVEGIEAVTKEEICEAAKKVVSDTIFMLVADNSEVAEDEN